MLFIVFRFLPGHGRLSNLSVHILFTTQKQILSIEPRLQYVHDQSNLETKIVMSGWLYHELPITLAGPILPLAPVGPDDSNSDTSINLMLYDLIMLRNKREASMEIHTSSSFNHDIGAMRCLSTHKMAL